MCGLEGPLLQEKLLTVTLVKVTQYKAICLHWHFSGFPNFPIQLLTVKLFDSSRGCHCNRLPQYRGLVFWAVCRTFSFNLETPGQHCLPQNDVLIFEPPLKIPESAQNRRCERFPLPRSPPFLVKWIYRKAPKWRLRTTAPNNAKCHCRGFHRWTKKNRKSRAFQRSSLSFDCR